MLSTLLTRKAVAVAVAAIAFACMVGLARPKPVADSGMSAEWQCSTTVGIMTTCTKARG